MGSGILQQKGLVPAKITMLDQQVKAQQALTGDKPVHAAVLRGNRFVQCNLDQHDSEEGKYQEQAGNP